MKKIEETYRQALQSMRNVYDKLLDSTLSDIDRLWEFTVFRYDLVENFEREFKHNSKLKTLTNNLVSEGDSFMRAFVGLEAR